MEKLERPFGVWTAAALVVGTMIGSGIFVMPAALATVGWTGTVSWLVGGAGVIVLAYVLALLTRRWPEEPSFLTICGDVLGLLPGRVLSWGYWCSVWVSVPVVAMTAAAYLLHLYPALPHGPVARSLCGTAIVVLLAANNLRGPRNAGAVQVLTTLLKLIPLVLVFALVAWLAVGSPQTFAANPVTPYSATQLTPALGLVFFAMLGFESASLVAERVRDPKRNVVRATLLGLFVVLAIYLVVSNGIVFSMPTAELAASSAPVADFVARFLGGWAGNAVALFAGISAIGCLNGLVLYLGELPLGLARDGQLPEWTAPTNRHDVAALPLLAGSMLAVALMLGSATNLGEQVLDFMLRLTTASAIYCYIGICAAAFAAGIARVLSTVGILFCLWVLYGTGFEAGGLSMLLMLLGVPLHFLLGGRTHAPLVAVEA